MQNLTHSLYEEFRLLSTSELRRAELLEQIDGFSDSVKISPNVKTQIPNFPDRP